MIGQPVVFKTEASLWEMLADGSKTWDARRWLTRDGRIERLVWGGVRRRIDSEGRDPIVKEVSFLNKADGRLLTFEYLGVEFASWAPGWGFLRLGKRIDNG